jgi:tryptophan synthase alpha chain
VNRIDRALQQARDEKRAALIVFVTAGSPDLATTAELVPELHAAGADVIELGVPHSDPIAEGPTIQASSLQALRQGTTLAQTLELVSQLRSSCDVPLVLMGYLNNVFAYGEESLVQAAADAGVDGLIVVDAPYDEVPGLQAACEAKGVQRILMVAPTSTPERVVAISSRSAGFVYCVSVTGVTGARSALPQELEELVARIQRVTTKPVCVGFGISTPEQAAAVGRIADGVVVGSALVSTIAAAASGAEAVDAASKFVGSLAKALRAGRA